jgi:putative ABC transport system permease protein
VVAFTLGISVLTGVVFTLIPAIQATGLSVAGSLRKAGTRTQTAGEHRLQKLLVVFEFACAVVLLAGAGLLIQSFIRMQHVGYGYDPHGLAIMPLLQSGPYRAGNSDQVLETAKAAPGIESAALMSFTSFGGLNFAFNVDGQPLVGGDVPVRYSSVSADYFRVLKARWITGREFNDRDSMNAPGVAIINEALGRQYFPGENPVGKKIVLAYLSGRIVREIVGVVGNIRQDAPSAPVRPEVFVHWKQLPWLAAVLVIRAHGDPVTAGKGVQQALRSSNPTLPPGDLQTVESMLGDQIAEPRLYLILLGTFAAAALLLAMIGIYGLLSYIVSRSLHDLAIRVAIGARGPDVVRLVLGEGIRLSILGIALGLIGAVVLTRVLKTLLFGVTTTDPRTFGAVALILFGVAVSACFFPARRATNADPVAALRHD